MLVRMKKKLRELVPKKMFIFQCATITKIILRALTYIHTVAFLFVNVVIILNYKISPPKSLYPISHRSDEAECDPRRIGSEMT